MARETLVIFGNGLGMALSPKLFSLTKGLEVAWTALDEGEKALFASLKGIEAESGPNGEADLRNVEIVCMIPRILESVADDPKIWLSDGLKGFNDVVRKFRKGVADYFIRHADTLTDFEDSDEPELDGNRKQWRSFIDQFKKFVWECRPNVATLNYDGLLYKAFIDEEVPGYPSRRICASGSQAALVDGFSPDFNPDLLTSGIDYYSNKRGRYMHLHGSALFYEAGSKLKKYRRADYSNTISTQTDHIVLTDHQFKRNAIARSRILEAYWDALELSLKEAKQVVLVGYGGEDKHLNELFLDRDFLVTVVQWKGSKFKQADWEGMLKLEGFNKGEELIEGEVPSKLTLRELDNILTFSDWQELEPILPLAR